MRAGLRNFLLIGGLGKMRPNTVMFGWKYGWNTRREVCCVTCGPQQVEPQKLNEYNRSYIIVVHVGTVHSEAENLTEYNCSHIIVVHIRTVQSGAQKFTEHNCSYIVVVRVETVHAAKWCLWEFK